MKNKNILKIMIASLLLFLIYIQPTAESQETRMIIGNIEFEDGTPATVGTIVYITNNDTGDTKIENTVSEGYYQTVLYASSGDEIWVNVSYCGNVGGNLVTIDHPAFKRCDVTISGNQLPNANFTYTPINPATSDNVQFTDISTDPENNTTTSWHWDFGDGSESNQKNPTHKFIQADTYQVALTARDYYGASDTTTKQITVQQSSSGNGNNNNPDPNQPPVAIAEIISYGYALQNITFDSSQSYDPDGNIVSYNWDFGDGNDSSQASPIHQYSENGTYSVVLTVTDDQGEPDSAAASITIYKNQNSCTKTVSIINQEFIEQNYNIIFTQAFYANDTDCDSDFDDFIDPNNKLTLLFSMTLEENKVFVLSTDNDDIPEFFWDPENSIIVEIKYTKPNETTTEINYTENIVYYEIKTLQKIWNYVEISDIYTKYEFIIKNSENQTLNDDRILRKNDKIFILDNSSKEYTIIYQYTILEPDFSIKNNSKVNTSKPTIEIKYLEIVEFIEAKLNNKGINLSIQKDNQTFVFEPEDPLKNGFYNLSITVNDSDGNLLTSILGFEVGSNTSDISKSGSDKKILSEIDFIPIVILAILILAVLVFFIIKKYWKKRE